MSYSESDALQDEMFAEIQYEEALRISALVQCIYLFVEGESEEEGFRIILEEGLGINFETYGVEIANYNGIGNLKHTVRLMNKTLSHKRPMIFTFDNDVEGQKSKNSLKQEFKDYIFFCAPNKSVVKYSNDITGGSFEEAFEVNDFINACFETTLLKNNKNVTQVEFENVFIPGLPWYDQIVKFLRDKGLTNFLPNKIEISESMAVACDPIPDTFVQLAELIKKIRSENPIEVKF